MSVLSGSVGVGGVNRSADVKLVQLLLNDWLGRGRLPLLEVDGIAGPLTNGAILRFQKAIRVPRADSRIDPGRATFEALTRAHLESLLAGVARARPPRFGATSTASPAPLDTELQTYLSELRKLL